MISEMTDEEFHDYVKWCSNEYALYEMEQRMNEEDEITVSYEEDESTVSYEE